jgi:N-formylglutamate amidohydrolase
MKAKSSVQKTMLYTEMKQSDMTAIDKKIHALLTAEGYAVVNTKRIANSGSNSDINVNRLNF